MININNVISLINCEKAKVSVDTVLQYYQNFVQITHKHVEHHCVQEKQLLTLEMRKKSDMQ